jgi:hypothetical protein
VDPHRVQAVGLGVHGLEVSSQVSASGCYRSKVPAVDFSTGIYRIIHCRGDSHIDGIALDRKKRNSPRWEDWRMEMMLALDMARPYRTKTIEHVGIHEQRRVSFRQRAGIFFHGYGLKPVHARLMKQASILPMTQS